MPDEQTERCGGSGRLYDIRPDWPRWTSCPGCPDCQPLSPRTRESLRTGKTQRELIASERCPTCGSRWPELDKRPGYATYDEHPSDGYHACPDPFHQRETSGDPDLPMGEGVMGASQHADADVLLIPVGRHKIDRLLALAKWLRSGGGRKGWTLDEPMESYVAELYDLAVLYEHGLDPRTRESPDAD